MNFADFVREHSEIIETITKAGGFSKNEVEVIEKAQEVNTNDNIKRKGSN